MFVRTCWQPWDMEAAYDLIQANPWARLVTNGAEGPHATNLPLLVDRGRGGHGVLIGHLARANAHARALLDAATPTLAIFEGPYSYVTASWYPERDMPSTYYYTAVHCYGRVRVQTDADLEAALGSLNERMESPIPDGWRMDEIPHSEITRRLPGIVGFEMAIDRIEAKFKLGQDEPRKDAMAVARRLAGAPEAHLRELAAMIHRANAERRVEPGS
jgi:transcriptional regulator